MIKTRQESVLDLENDLMRALEKRGLSAERAREFAYNLLAECERDIEQRRLSWVSDSWIDQHRDELVHENVMDVDLNWWSALSELERAARMKLEFIDRQVAFLAHLEDEVDCLITADAIRIRLPIFGDPFTQPPTHSASRPLHPALLGRVKALLDNPIEHEALIQGARRAGSLNAAIRSALSRE